ncbi:hypothetical protein CRYO30217_02776 [Parvicella tangerina]|uniref:Uncharacterized protein n=1 Tax=Parvicella tangerina TaxID=2829795 RepID=A0A916JPG7_9FLAO|nr:hypothetical protein CRYO30217_02776 [Parvicella tangerina]
MLQTKVAEKLQEIHPEVGINMQEWKGDEIALFREELQITVQGTVSEKWFYTHIKNEQEKLPRVDTLNLLSQYIGLNSWSAFCHENGTKNEKEGKTNQPKVEIIDSPKKKGLGLYVILSLIVIGMITLVMYFSFDTEKPTHYKICFVDEHTHLPVADSFLEIKMIKGDESPMFYPLESSCFSGMGDEVDFIVKGRFYKPLHVKRKISNDAYEETIFLEPDDYSMILHLFANSQVEDWKERRNQLSEMLHESLKAYEISKDGFTIDVLNKDEFINRMTIPTKVLKKVAIVYTEYDGDKMSLIKFTQE